MITLVSLAMGLPSLLEWLLFYYPIKRTRIVKDPVYIVGFWRSGTTFLQNLMTRDPQFAWFDPVKTVTFNNCILLKPFVAMVEKRALKNARPMDNMEYRLDLPMEEVFALGTISTQAISHMLAFPDGGRGVKYIETAFVDETDAVSRKKWRKSYDYVLRKATFLSKGKQLVLKSPENTCRIAELKKCYPHAKFINIYRNPYDVIMSTIHMFTKEMNTLCLNEPAPASVIEQVSIDLFERTYKKAIPEMEKLPKGDCVNIRYEDFCKNKEADMEKIYKELHLDGYQEAKPYFKEYIESEKNYKKNKFTLTQDLKEKINAKLGFYFDYYGYEML